MTLARPRARFRRPALPFALAGVIGQAVAGAGRDLAAERDRWFLWGTVLFGAGVAAYFALPSEPSLVAVLGLFAATSALVLVWREGLASVVVGGSVLAIVAGIAAAKSRTETAGGPQLVRPQNAVWVSGYVELVEPRQGRGERVTLRVRELGRLPATERPLRARIRLLQRGTFKAGDAIRVRATLAAPSRPALPGDYDFARSAWFQGLGAVGYALGRAERDLAAPPPPFDLAFWAAIEGARQAINARIRAVLPGETGAIAAALVVGERGGITDATNDAFRASGLYHLLSISGLHMVIVAGAAFWAVRFVLALLPWVALNWPTAKVAAVVAALAATAYLLISGGAPATARSWLMVLIGFGARLADRPAIALRTVALAALAMLAVRPETLLDVGFQMSFAAVTALVAAYEEVRTRMIDRRRDPPGTILRVALFFGGIVLSTVIAGFAVAPFSAYHFHQTQQYALLANLVAIPLSNIVVMPAALVATLAMPVGLETLPLLFMGWGIDATVATARAVAAIPGALIALPAMPDGAFYLMVLGGLWLCLWRRRWRLAGLVPIALGIAWAPYQPRADIIVGQEGPLVAVRGTDGLLNVPPGKPPSFEFKRWREHDGAPVDSRTRSEPVSSPFRCDPAGCTARVGGLLIAAPSHREAWADDCRMADIVVLPGPKPHWCRPRLLVIDVTRLRAYGTHVVQLGPQPTIATVQEARGVRPWTGPPPRRAPVEVRPAERSRLGEFAGGATGTSPANETGDQAADDPSAREDDDQ
jgi:competence protein ComEC